LKLYTFSRPGCLVDFWLGHNHILLNSVTEGLV
jgi:hypothetical protein